MNKNRKQKNRMSVLGLALTGIAFSLIFALSVSADYGRYPTDDRSQLSSLKAVLHPGAGEQYINGHIILDSAITPFSSSYSTYFDARGVDANGKKRPSFFQASKNVAHSVLASLYDFTVVDGPLFIGLPLGAFQSSVSGDGFGLDTTVSNSIVRLWTHDYGIRNPFSATLQKVNIAGAVRSSAIAHQYRDTQRVCVNADGIFTLNCPAVTQTYSCIGTTPSNATLCSGDDQGLAQDTNITLVSSCTNTQKCEYTCDQGYHEDNGSCVEDATYHWETGDWGQCSQATQAYCEGDWVESECRIDFECDGIDPNTNYWNYLTPESQAVGCDSNNEVVLSSASSVADCNDKSLHMCDGFPASNTTTDNNGCDSFDQGSYEVHYDYNSYQSAVSHDCSASNPQSPSACESQSSACHWVDAQDSVRRRSVNCVEDQSGTVVADSNCDANTRPEDTDECMRVRAYIAKNCNGQSVAQCCSNYNTDSEVGRVDIEFTSDSQDIFAPNFKDNKMSFKYKLHPVAPLGYPDGVPVNVPYTFHPDSYQTDPTMNLDAGRYAIKSSGAKISTSNGARAIIQITGNGNDAKLESISFCGGFPDDQCGNGCPSGETCCRVTPGSATYACIDTQGQGCTTATGGVSQ